MCGCNKPKPCGCVIKPKGCREKDMSTDCILYTGDNLVCSGIQKDTILTDVIKQLDSFICDKINDIDSFMTIKNIGSGSGIYAGDSTLGEKELKSLTSLGGSLVITSTGSTINLESQPTAVESKGAGTAIYAGIEDGAVQIVSLQSDSLSIDINEDGSLQIENPPSFTFDGIPRFIVNNLYTGTTELGTLTKPFKTIQAAITAFVGAGTQNAPQFENGIIIIQKSNDYNFTGNFSYRNINVILEEGAIVNHTPSGDQWLINYDLLSDAGSKTTLTIQSGANLRLNANGFKNRGVSTLGTGTKVIIVEGDGTVQQLNTYSATSSVFESNIENTPDFVNGDDNTVFAISNLNVISRFNAIWRIGGQAQTIVEGAKIRSGYSFLAVNFALKAFYQTGGTILINNTSFILESSNKRDFGFNFKSSVGFTAKARFTRSEIQGLMSTLFVEETADITTESELTVYNTTSRYIDVVQLFSSITKWTGVLFKGNIFETGQISSAEVDLTQTNTISVSNHISGLLVNSLCNYASRAAASGAGGSLGSMFFNTTTDSVDIII